MSTAGFPDDRFVVSSSPESAAENPEFEGANVCRVAALSTMLGNDRDGIRALEPELEELGFGPSVTSGDWNWSDVSVVNAFSELRVGVRPREQGRVERWQMIGETMRPQAAVAFMVDVLGSSLERESVAAAAALWRQLRPFDTRRFWRGPPWWHLWDRLFELEPEWLTPGWPEFLWGGPDLGSFDPDDLDEQAKVPWEPERWTALYERAMTSLGDPYADVLLVRMLCGWRIGRGLRSRDPVTRSLAMAAIPPPSGGGSAIEPATAFVATPPGALFVSTMVHGTWGWKGDWWRPGSDFHRFILHAHRPNLYSRGAKFSWSGAYSESQRALAARDFREWAYDVAPHGLQTVFGHSYGGEVAARALLDGARIAELVLLSVPVTALVEAAAATGVPVVDVRLKFDPVLGIARLRQRLTQRLRPEPNVTEVLLEQWRYDHGASHHEDVWRAEDVARRGRI
jgi:pimeloyl-ACP methyl ester carboxylesterase